MKACFNLKNLNITYERIQAPEEVRFLPSIGVVGIIKNHQRFSNPDLPESMNMLGYMAKEN